MFVKPSSYLIMLGISLCWLSCANIMTPTGGPRDEKAPILKKRSLTDSALNFKGGVIRFEFDEFVQVKDVQNQLVVTPLLKKNPKVTVHKKRVTVDIEDSLLEPNTTYAISMGNAIQDMREGNPYPNLAFTFSTGSYFDSLSLKGTVIEANTGKPDTSGWAVLYKAGLPDSSFYNEKPLYIQKLVNGTFFFRNLPDKFFTLFVLDDKNKNLRYDLASERIAFYDKNVTPRDSLPIVLYSFIADGDDDTIAKKKLMKQTTLLAVKPSPLADKKAVSRLNYSMNADTLNKSKRTMDIMDSVKLSFDHPLLAIDAAKIQILHDELVDTGMVVRLDTSKKVIIIRTIWSEDAQYKVVLQKGFAQDSAGLQATAANIVFRTKRKSDYGTLVVQYKKDEMAILELMKNDKVVARKNATDTLIIFPLLQPDTYQVRVLHDANNNGVWDTGSFFGEKKQPEHMALYPAVITIKANWENKIDLKSAFLKKPELKK